MSEICAGSGKPVESGSCCRECGRSFGHPDPANLVVGSLAPEHPVSRFADERPSLNEAGIARLCQQVEDEILEDMENGIMPTSVRDYSTLHDHVDANCYGGACDDDTTLTLGDIVAMQDIVSRWLHAGLARREFIDRHRDEHYIHEEYTGPGSRDRMVVDVVYRSADGVYFTTPDGVGRYYYDTLKEVRRDHGETVQVRQLPAVIGD